VEGERVIVDTRRTLLVRLSDLPLDVHLRAAREVAKEEADPIERLELDYLARHPRPEHDLHWVDASAVELLRELRGERERAA
jgi:hypothetical protein